ncbi:hypothetical protein BDW22DRAFT_993460 [Trametopsis cervina]|nr:hypothetical protein BDW22DRAFT_993460 [Trametopsis cervina]
MAGRKRAADTEGDGPKTRSKVAKTTGEAPSKAKGGKKPKVSIGATAFKSHALPLHVNLTHTPPAIGGDDTQDSAQADPGFLGSTALVPTTFNTGSYGWKGNKRITVELLNSESGKKEMVQVSVSINATVIGSKKAADDAPGEASKEDEAEAEAEAEAETSAAAEGDPSNEVITETDES